VRKPDLRGRLQGIRSVVGEAGAEYDAAAVRGALFEMERQANVGTVTDKEMVAVYSGRFAKAGRPGRPVYDRIISAPKNERCPLCDIGTVNTLDHYLPKKHYPVLAVTPNNLVPACQWCQWEKGEAYPNEAADQPLHPYYDDAEFAIWLSAVVEQTVPATFRFYVEAPEGWDPVFCQRLRSHLKTYGLSRLYARNAGGQLAGIRLRLHRLFDAGGADAVRSYLREEVESWQRESLNSWRAVMYRAAIASKWFCEGGFLPE
jgi:hypothetical protein